MSIDQLWREAILLSSATVGEAVRNLDDVGIKIVMVVNEDGVLQGTISDGDIRRGLLKGFDLNSQITSVIRENPFVVRQEMERKLVLQLMQANKIQQIPVVDDLHRVVGLHLLSEIVEPLKRSNSMVIMAGGMGTRLLPHTKKCPKPLLKVAGKPMLEHIIDRAKIDGFNHFVIAIHYLGEMIESHFGSGESLGVQIDYLREESPLGTAGALGLLKSIPELPFIVANGDVISNIRYGELLDFHERHAAVATMAVRIHEWQHPFGVVNTKGIEIMGFEEKPVSRTLINAGVYALNPAVLHMLRSNIHCDMPNLFEKLKALGKSTVAFPIHESWTDVGRPDDLVAINTI